MSTKPENPENGGTSDLRIVRWLVHFARPYGWFLALALLFMVFTAGLELLIPYIIKVAVDGSISPAWRTTTVPDAGAGIAMEHPDAVIVAQDGTTLIDLSRLGRKDRTELERSGVVGEQRIFVIDPSTIAESEWAGAKAVIESHPGMFKSAGEAYYAPEESLGALPTAELGRLRSRDLARVLKLGLYIVAALVGVFISSSIFTLLLQYSGQRIMHNIRGEVFGHLLTLPQRFFDTNPVGRLSTRVTNDVNAINEMYTSVLVQFVKDILVITGVLIIMFSMSTLLTLFILVLAIIFAIFGAIFRMKLRRAYRNVRRSIAALNAFVQESVRGIVLLKLYQRQSENMERFEVVSRENFLANMQQVIAFATFRPVIEFISVFAVALILWHGGLGVLKLQLTLGALLAYLAYIRMLFGPLLELAERYNILQSAIAASENLYELQSTEPEKRLPVPEAGQFRGRVEFKNVWFAYEGDDWVLRDVSFEVNPGETVALVGLTGSGKTTIVNLLLKLYDPGRGEILIDGMPIAQYDPIYLRSHISTVFQDLFLFGKGISDGGGADNGYFEGFIGERVGLAAEERLSLSSGEKQLASFADAFARDTKMLVLDEATSNVDAELEARVQELVKADKASRTTLIVAHRLSNIKNADRIIVLHKGAIHETGTHSELVENGGIYQHLYRLQNEMHSYSLFAD